MSDKPVIFPPTFQELSPEEREHRAAWQAAGRSTPGAREQTISALQFQLAEAKLLLRKVEWCEVRGGLRCCWFCGGYDPDYEIKGRGHAADCHLGRVLEGT